MNKLRMSRLLSVVLAVAMVLTLGLGAVPASAEETKTLQVLFTSDLHGCFSDWSYSTDSAFTGLARVAATINSLRNDNTLLIDVGDTIQGNGTSVFHTAAWDKASANKDGLYPVLSGMEYLEYDAWVLGNHEFNFGVDRLEKAYGKGTKNEFSGAVLGGNIFKDGAKSFNYDDAVYDSFMVKELDGVRVAVIGMTHPNIVNWDSGNLSGVYDTRSASEMTEKTIKYLKGDYVTKDGNEPIDVFIAAQHMSDSREYGEGSGAEDVIAKCKDDLSLFIGAHGHSNQDKLIDGVRYVENGSNAGRLGQVEIKVTKQEDGSWAVADNEADVTMTSHTIGSKGDTLVEADADYLKALSAADTFAKDYARTEIGKLTGGPLVPEAEIVDTYEAYLQDTPLVHLINDAMIYYANSYVENDPELKKKDVEVTLSGTAPLDTNANAQPGSLTRGKVSTIYKYDNNTLCIVEMTGEQFKAWMEWGYVFMGPFTGTGSGYEAFDLGPAMKDGDLTIPYGNGNMPGYNMDQFEGVTYNVDLTKPYGERIVDLKDKATGEDFDLEKTYWVAVNNYRADTQLLINADEGSRPAVFPEGKKAATLVAREIDAILTVDGKSINNGEGMLGLMADYIGRVKGGEIDDYGYAKGEFEANWAYITPDIDEELRAQAVELINSGELDIKVNNGYGRRAATVADLDAPSASIDNFTDINSSDWFYASVATMYELGLMNGTSDTTFSPQGDLTREMFVTILYRLADSPEAGDSEFTDVPAGNWYSDAIAWGAQNEIVLGADENTFGLGNKVTRQEMAVLIYRYVQSIDAAEGVTPDDLAAFNDTELIASWAEEALMWSVGAELIKGSDNMLSPLDTATRAEAAALFVRTIEFIEATQASNAA